MKMCWNLEPTERPTFSKVGQMIARLLGEQAEQVRLEGWRGGRGRYRGGGMENMEGRWNGGGYVEGWRCWRGRRWSSLGAVTTATCLVEVQQACHTSQEQAFCTGHEIHIG